MGFHSELLAVLVAKQAETGLSGQQFAAKLGIKQQHWSALITGRTCIGPKVYRGAMRAYPDLISDVLRYLLAPEEGAMPTAGLGTRSPNQ